MSGFLSRCFSQLAIKALFPIPLLPVTTRYSLIYLVADICKRNGIQKLRWFHDKTLVGKVDKSGEPVQNMTLHKWFKNKACPGQYLEERMFEIAAKVNALL